MDVNLQVVGTVISNLKTGFTNTGKPTCEFALSHQYINDKTGEVFETKWFTTMLNGNADWAEAYNLVKGDKVMVLGSEVTATAYASKTGPACTLNLKANHVTRVDPGSRDYLAAQLLGNAGNDAEMRYTSDGRPYTSMRLGTNAGYPGSNGKWVDKTNWYNVTIFGNTEDEGGTGKAERAANIAKGDKVMVILQSMRGNPYERDGKLAASVDVIANSMRLVSRKSASTNSGRSAPDADVLAAMGIEPAPTAEEDVDF
jgi:single-strand DNA-binding protein